MSLKCGDTCVIYFMLLRLSRLCYSRLTTLAQKFGKVLAAMDFEFNGTIWYWRGPAPFYFVTVPAEQSREIKAVSSYVTYGWGVIPVDVEIGGTRWKTSLFPKDDLYLVPIKASVRKAERLEEGDDVTLRLEVTLRLDFEL